MEQAPSETMDQNQLIAKAKEAAASGDPVGMAEAIYASGAVDGLVRRIRFRWSVLDKLDAEDVVAEAMATLYETVNRGEKVFNPVAFMWKVADRKANHLWRTIKNQNHIESWENVTAGSGIDSAEANKISTAERENNRNKAISIARQLLPRLGQQNVTAVMGYLIDAVEAGRWDVSNQEIGEALGLTNDTVRTSLSRGFRRLNRLAQEEGISNNEIGQAWLKADEQAEEVSDNDS